MELVIESAFRGQKQANQFRLQEESMEQKQDRIRIELTDEQKQQIKRASGEDVSALEFTREELEQRIAPIGAIKWVGAQ